MTAVDELTADVEGCLAAVDGVRIGTLLQARPVLTAEIQRVGDQAKLEPYQYSAFASYVDVPLDEDKRRKEPAA